MPELHSWLQKLLLTKRNMYVNSPLQAVCEQAYATSRSLASGQYGVDGREPGLCSGDLWCVTQTDCCTFSWLKGKSLE